MMLMRRSGTRRAGDGAGNGEILCGGQLWFAACKDEGQVHRIISIRFRNTHWILFLFPFSGLHPLALHYAFMARQNRTYSLLRLKLLVILTFLDI